MLDTLRRVLDRAVADSAFPGAFVVVGRRSGIIAQLGAGHLDLAPSPVPDEHTLWDMASLTKVLALTSAMMQLVEQGKVELDAPVQRYLPQWTGPNKARVTVRDLLTHRSGLPAWRPIYKEATTPTEALALVVATPLDTLPGVRMVYSDLGAILMGEIVRAVSGQRIDAYTRDHVFAPLGMKETGYLPDPSLLSRIAPTEVDPWRQRHLRGEVHDENAFALGGVAGHAGLFGTASDLAVFAQMLLDGGTYNGVHIVADSTIKQFTARAAGSRALGWEVGEGQHGSGNFLRDGAFGHTGFTGTSLWIDPDREMFVILLTNRVHAAKAKRPAKVIADVRQDLSDAAALAVTDENLAVAAMPASFRADRAVDWNKPTRKARKPKKPSSSKTKGSSANKSPAKSSSSAKKPAAKKSSSSKSSSKSPSKSSSKSSSKSPAKKPASKKTPN